MLDPKNIRDLIQDMMNRMPPAMQTLPQDIKENIRAALQGGLARLDLVTREEFDTQANVLLKTRQKLEALEKQVKALEETQKP